MPRSSTGRPVTSGTTDLTRSVNRRMDSTRAMSSAGVMDTTDRPSWAISRATNGAGRSLMVKAWAERTLRSHSISDFSGGTMRLVNACLVSAVALSRKPTGCLSSASECDNWLSSAGSASSDSMAEWSCCNSLTRSASLSSSLL